MHRSVRLIALGLALLAMTAGQAGAQGGWPLHDRIYLLGSEDDFFYWSVDPNDPELDLSREERTCSIAIEKGLPGHRDCALYFLPGSLLGEPLKWGGARGPLRFHLDLEVATPGTPTVTVRIERNGSPVEATATETSPGTWEATIAGAGTMDPGSWSMVIVRVSSTVDHLTASLALDGASYVDLPSPVVAAGVPQLKAEEQAPAIPDRFDTALRSFWFNDDAWRVASFEGDLSQMREFTTTLERPAAAVIAWVEVFGTPFTHDVLRGRDPDARKITEAFQTDVLANGQRIASGYSSGVYGVGTDGAAATDVPAGTVTLQVEPTTFWPTDVNHDSPYRAYILAIEGQRTLARMRWPSMFGGYPGITVTQAPMAGVCPGTPQQQIPTTDALRTFSVEMRADTVGGPTSKWTLGFLMPPNSWWLCGEMSLGDRMRFTFPHDGVHLVGAMLQEDTTHSEWRETVFEWTADFTYAPPPAA